MTSRDRVINSTDVITNVTVGNIIDAVATNYDYVNIWQQKHSTSQNHILCHLVYGIASSHRSIDKMQSTQNIDKMQSFSPSFGLCCSLLFFALNRFTDFQKLIHVSKNCVLCTCWKLEEFRLVQLIVTDWFKLFWKCCHNEIMSKTSKCQVLRLIHQMVPSIGQQVTNWTPRTNDDLTVFYDLSTSVNLLYDQLNCKPVVSSLTRNATDARHTWRSQRRRMSVLWRAKSRYVLMRVENKLLSRQAMSCPYSPLDSRIRFGRMRYR